MYKFEINILLLLFLIVHIFFDEFNSVIFWLDVAGIIGFFIASCESIDAA